jgi:DNA-binding MarR family transcriptional regulator
MGWCPDGDKLDQDIFDAMTEFFAHVAKRGEQLAEHFNVPMFCVKAMRRLDTSVSMKELGRRMACDPSFVTMIADALEDRGLARREPSASDRRIKNLVLTPEGLEIKGAIDQALLRQMPWTQALEVSERETLLSLLRKMISAFGNMPEPSADAERTGEVSGTTTIAAPAAS